jgi:DNA-binding response OmpR family regulator
VLEANENWPRRPIIALTANAFAEDRQKCFDVGMDRFLSKPISKDALFRELAAALEQPPQARQQAAPGPPETAYLPANAVSENPPAGRPDPGSVPG